MSILSSIGRMKNEYNAARARYRTERAIRSLPIELRKDIGWPEATDRIRCETYGAAFASSSKHS